MNLVPVPQKIDIKEGKFRVGSLIDIHIEYCTSFKSIYPFEKFKERLAATDIKVNINKSLKSRMNGNLQILCEEDSRLGALYKGEEGYVIQIKEECIQIKSAYEKGIFYGMQTLTQIFEQSGGDIPCMEIIDYPVFSVRGFYHDITRGKVPTLGKLKEIVDDLSKYKINQFQLYVEHAFPFRGHEEIYSDIDPITPEEILLLDEYCIKNHIEMVPSIATFGHLYHLLSSQKYGNLCEISGSEEKEFSWVDRMRHHTIDISNPYSIEVIQNMIEDYLPLFSSDKFNICCDETFDLGRGRSKAFVEDKGRGRAYLEFLNKLIDIVKGHGKIPMFWGDIILKYPELLGEIDENVICLNWNYSSEATDEGTKVLKNSGRKYYNCPGVWGWDRFMNDIKGSFQNINRMVQYGESHGAEGILNTDWGDYGHINFYSSSKPGMILGGALSWNTDMKNQEKSISICEFGDDEIVDILKELGEQQYICFMEIVWWLEDKIGATTLLKDREELKDKYLSNRDENKLKQGYEKAREIVNMLQKKLFQNRKCKNDLNEFIVSAEAVALMNSLFLYIKEIEMGEEVSSQIHSREELADLIREWIIRFREAWRRDNKESELGRIGDAFGVIDKFLREYH